MMALTTLSVLGSFLVLQTAKDAYSYYAPPGQCTNDAISIIWTRLPKCIPRETLVKLPLPDDADVVEVIPSHVVVPRCGGVCHQGNLYHHCVPETGQRSSQSFQVMFRLMDSSVGNGQQQTECSSIEVETHEKCKCGCDVEANKCSPKQVGNVL